MGQCIAHDQPGIRHIENEYAPHELRERNKQIEQLIRTDSKTAKNDIKLLLLGAGDSGKSTVLKQMELIFGNGFTVSMRNEYIPVIISNLVSGLQHMLCALSRRIETHPEEFVAFDDPSNSYIAEISSMSLSTTSTFSDYHKRIIKALMSHANVKAVIKSSSEQTSITCAWMYYFEHIDRITQAGYVPTDTDILLSRKRTTGISESTFQLAHCRMSVIDVGGQRSERSKWIHCFQDITAVIFFASLSEYDQTLYEDAEVSRLSESLALFADICNGRWFAKCAFILFFNKRDIFEEKIRTRPIRNYINFYTGKDGDYPSALQFIQNLYFARNSTEKTIFPHVTCATDTNNIRHIFTSIRETILFKSQQTVGF